MLAIQDLPLMVLSTELYMLTPIPPASFFLSVLILVSFLVLPIYSG